MLIAGADGEKSQFPNGLQSDHLSEQTVGHGTRVRGISDPTTYPVIAGDVGEYKESAAGSAAALTNITYSDCGAAPLVLTPGVWEVQATCYFVAGATTTILQTSVHIGTQPGNSSGGQDGLRNSFKTTSDNWVPGANSFIYCTPTWRVTITGDTSVYCKGWSQFGVSTLTAQGFIRATRVA